MTWDDETRARAAGMKRAGMTNKQIAVRLGVTERSVAHICSKAGAYRRLDHSKTRFDIRRTVDRLPADGSIEDIAR